MPINGIGRPYKFKDVATLQNKIDDFFNITPEDEQTITGLALHLDTYREVLMDYQRGLYDKHFDNTIDFSDTIKRAKTRIADGYEKRCIKRGNAGDIFALKNFGWTDRQDINMNVTQNRSLSELAEQAETKKITNIKELLS